MITVLTTIIIMMIRIIKNNINALRAYTATVPMTQYDVPEVSRRWAQVSWNTRGRASLTEHAGGPKLKEQAGSESLTEHAGRTEHAGGVSLMACVRDEV